MKRGFSLASLGTLALSLVIVSVTLLVGYTIIIKTNISVFGTQPNNLTQINVSNISANVGQGVFDIATWIPLVVLVAIGAFLIYLIMGSFGGANRQ